MSQLFISYEDFDPERVQPLTVESKKSKATITPENPQGSQKTYYICKIFYKYQCKTDSGELYDRIEPLCVRHPKLRTTIGITYRNKKIGEKGENISRGEWINLHEKGEGEKALASIPIKFDLSDPKQLKLVGEIGSLDHKGIPVDGKIVGFYQKLLNVLCERLFKIRDRIDMDSCRNILDIRGKLDNSDGYIHYPKTDGADPTKFFTLKSFGKYGSFSWKETKFQCPIFDPLTKDFKKIEWESLTEVDAEFIPDIVYPNIMVAVGKIFLKDFLNEALIESVVPSDSGSNQKELLENMSKNREIVTKLASQLDTLNLIRSKGKNETVDHVIEPSEPKTLNFEVKSEPVVEQKEEKPIDDDDDEDKIRERFKKSSSRSKTKRSSENEN